MKEIVEILRLLGQAIAQNTRNTIQDQGYIAADVVFKILEDAAKKINELEGLIAESEGGE